MQHLQKTGGWGLLWLTSHSARKPQSMNSFVFMLLRTLFRDGGPLGLFSSIASALFPSRRRAYPPCVRRSNVRTLRLPASSESAFQRSDVSTFRRSDAACY